MKFNHLQASITNNADQTPTLYMALCMVESLFMDMEDSCGRDINLCPVGDERLPTKLAWLCRFINDTYRDNSEEFQRGRNRLETAMEQMEQTRKKLEASSAVAERLAALKAEASALDRKLQAQSAAAEECKKLKAQCDRAREELEALSRFNPGAAKAELEQLSRDIAEQESTKATLTNQLTQARQSLAGLRQENARLQTECNGLTLDISRQKAEIEALSERLAHSRKNLDAQQQERSRLNKELSDCLQKLGALQTEVERLSGEQLPEARALFQREQQRQQELSQSVERLQSRFDTIQSENAEQAARLQKLEAGVQEKQAVYDALTAKCAASSQELMRLEQQIAELRSNDDETKLGIYRRQLEDNQRKLEEIRQDCSRIEEENARAQQELEDGESQRDRLLELKHRHESGIRAVEKQLRELKFAGTDEYVHEVMALDERIKLLENVRGKLSASIEKMRKILGHAPMDQNASLEEQMKHELRELQLRTEVLCGVLVDCAKSLKMEEQ